MTAAESPVGLSLEELIHQNAAAVRSIDRSDVSEAFVDTVDTILQTTDYGAAHHCQGHTFAIRQRENYIGLILLSEALPWPTDPPEMRREPFYRLMGFVLDRRFRSRGFGGAALEMTVERVYADFGVRPIALGCHRDNEAAARFYLRHGFRKTACVEGSDIYYLRYPGDSPGASPFSA